VVEVTRPSNEEFRSIIDELLNEADAQAGLRTRGRSGRLVTILGGLELEVCQTARATLLLIDKGFCDAATPLARKVFEYGVVAQWLNLTKNTDAYFVVSNLNWKKLDKETEATGMDLPSEVIAEMRNCPAVQKTAESNTLQNFSEVCQAFEGGALYLLYRFMSGSCHPWAAATGRWLREDENPMGLGFTNPEAIDPVLILWPLVAGLLWTGRALDLQIVHKPRQQALKAAGQRLGIDTVLKGTIKPPKSGNSARRR
jgi:hypothetical protein